MTSPDLPDGWRETPLGELAQVRYGKGLRRQDRTGSGGVTVIGSSGPVGLHDEALVEGPVVVVGRKGSAGSVHLVEGPAWPIDTTYYLEPPEGMDLRFLRHQLGFLALRKLDSSTAVPSLRRPDLESVSLRVPPLDEQHRIVEAIETHLSHLDAGVGSIQRAKRNLERIRWSAVAEEFDSDAPLMRIDRVCERPQYGWTTKSTDHAPSGLRLLRITDIQEGRVEWQSVPWCVEEPQDPGKYLLREGDVLVARSGATVGKSHLIKDPPPAVFASYLIRLRATSDVLSEYLACFLESPQYWQQISSAKAGIAQPNVNGRKLAALLLPVPGISEQERTVLRLQRLGSIVANLNKSLSDALKRAQALRRAVLAEAFAGTLTTRSGSEFAA